MGDQRQPLDGPTQARLVRLGLVLLDRGSTDDAVDLGRAIVADALAGSQQTLYAIAEDVRLHVLCEDPPLRTGPGTAREVLRNIETGNAVGYLDGPTFFDADSKAAALVGVLKHGDRPDNNPIAAAVAGWMTEALCDLGERVRAVGESGVFIALPPTVVGRVIDRLGLTNAVMMVPGRGGFGTSVLGAAPVGMAFIQRVRAAGWVAATTDPEREAPASGGGDAAPVQEPDPAREPTRTDEASDRGRSAPEAPPAQAQKPHRPRPPRRGRCSVCPAETALRRGKLPHHVRPGTTEACPGSHKLPMPPPAGAHPERLRVGMTYDEVALTDLGDCTSPNDTGCACVVCALTGSLLCRCGTSWVDHPGAGCPEGDTSFALATWEGGPPADSGEEYGHDRAVELAETGGGGGVEEARRRLSEGMARANAEAAAELGEPPP